MIELLGLIQMLLLIVSLIVIAQAVMSWLIGFNIINTYNDTVRDIYRLLNRLTDPLYRPIRRIMPNLGALDLSPLIVLLIIQVINNWIIPAIARSVLGSGLS
ncbi:YggT family protein [Sphingomonas sp.]|uniref:YggT family protein n=1 Tax=Sphingomonas sp. TaxID=28214 RepID=UPI0025D05C30|nr:YggT family protein [Sphingomonas sp.]